MAHVQYQTTVDWDPTLKDLGYVDSDTIGAAFAGLVESAIKVTAGAPTATVGKFIPAAQVKNAVSGITYTNTGSTAAPVWSVISVGGGGGMVIGGAVTGGTATQILFVGAGAVLDQSASLTWNDLTQVFSITGTLSGTSFSVNDTTRTIAASTLIAGVGAELQVNATSAGSRYTTGANSWGFFADNSGGGASKIFGGATTYTWPAVDAIGVMKSNGTGSLSLAPAVFTGAALATHSHDLQYSSAEVLTVTPGTGLSSLAAGAPIGIVESVYVTAGGVTGAFTVIPSGIIPATKECTYDQTTGQFFFLIADAVTSATVSYVSRAVSSVSGGTPAGTIA